ncbi:MAG: hypothetical protein C0490_16555, partial [Marivirga sp.]|nr:hypothetical protein [Marivirga sp.]
FGISAGAGYNSLDLENIDYSNDPAIIGAADNRAYADGNFGVLYSLYGLKVGFALPRLFGQPYVSPQSLQGNRSSQLKNQLYSISYKFDAFQGNVSLEPYFFYRLNRDNQNSWESSLLIHFKEKVWTGASYHNSQGIAFFLGMLIKERLRFGYGYELPPPNNEFVSTSSHEVHLSLRLGKKKANKLSVEGRAEVGVTVATDSARETENIPPEPQHVPQVEKEHVNTLPPIEKITPSDSSGTLANDGKAPGPPKSLVLSPGYYVIVGSYRNVENALHLQNSLKTKGHSEVYTGLYGKKGIYYVYTFSTYDLDEAKEKVKIYASIADFRDVWILKIDR